MSILQASDRASTTTESIYTAAQPALSARDVTVRYRGSSTAAVENVSLDIAPGERIALVGESGSGKTTFGLAAAGFLDESTQVSAAKLDIDGTSVLDRKHHRIPRRTPGLSMIFQDAMTSLDPVFTIGSQIGAVVRGSGVPRKEVRDRSRHWLSRVGLTDTARVLAAHPRELSGGMRQRAMIAIALAGSPRLLIADEPTSALDAALARSTMQLLVELSSSNEAALLMISHDIALCREFSDRTVVMYRGVAVEQIASADLTTKAQHPYTQGLVQCVPTLASAELDELPTLDWEPAA